MAYFPNGSSGEVLDSQCSKCPLGDAGCPILLVQLNYNYKQLDEGQAMLKEAMNLLVADDGTCSTFKLLQSVKGAISPEEVQVLELAEEISWTPFRMLRNEEQAICEIAERIKHRG